ncbi:uncharacterized protein NECHADRAFT_103550 [Fusarium vanettenii 77-13-4]|uniref:Uncharacterized protein n=1 Tax=Fusarium vanettenii (strain ATCC MYA-4622 / CBS 123669 / FGSC 9596 / NRRL 45880 / 77-13-4) TaxID=660122 RepID=C7Z5A2_FUSV7|nr:uncharacterized protein NECHADRAFT_103550 [Fusarium vanettenii 77-13-4]EEU41063.1 hypothetical protein NECHADRAFT_103550 [Fusarium vanettenii 77-13-4]
MANRLWPIPPTSYTASDHPQTLFAVACPPYFLLQQSLTVFPTIEPNSSTRPASHSRRVSTDRGSHSRPPAANFASSRPATSSVATSAHGSHYHTLPRPSTASRPPLSRYQRPPMPQTQSTPPKVSSRKSSFVRAPDSPAIIPESRDSISSNGSWIRRLSIRPLSRNESSRSSAGQDTPSIFSHGSAAPILRGPTTPTLPPNKLVKRSRSSRNDPDPPRRRSKSHLPTLPVLRRPATSHQRSATLQQFRPDSPVINTPTSNNFSFDDHRPHEFLTPPAIDPPSRSASARRSGRFSELSPHARAPVKRICIDDEQSRVHLVKPRMEEARPVPALVESTPSPEGTPSRVPRKSVSMPFASAGTWAVKSGSIRRPKRGAEPRIGNKRHVSEPVTGALAGAEARANPLLELTLPPSSPSPGRQGLSLGSAAVAQLRTRKRNSSSPVPPLSRLSSFHVDASRLGSSGGVSNHTRPNQPSGSSASSTAMSQLRAPQHDRTSTMESSEDTRDCTSGDDDDTDFKSDTMFDSLRTVGSGRARAVETPLESMYDESPPSTANGNGKTKRLSIHEMLGRTWDEDDKIMEEDENVTPVRTVNRDANRRESPRFRIDSSPRNVSISATKEFSRLSLDDDFDDDWARDDELPCNPLSPPSKGSSLNSRGINPNVRLALANISGNGLPDHDHNERPLSTLFDWSEPPTHDKFESGRSPRPKTAYAKQEMDSRGGRSAIRKGPTPTHVRSQSVPVVHDSPDDSKSASKYGTWGLGTKTASEDWDDDFEFGGSSLGSNDKDDKVFAVPESIRATQPSVKAHSGHIREFSLLVNDLKRLCRHGRDMDILDGPQSHLWEEADGIIALASPDEESLDEDDDQKSTSSINFDAFDIDERFGDEGFDAHSMNRLDAAFDGHEPAMSKTAVVRERHSPRRRSVFSPEDDIFGNWPLTDNHQPSRPSRPRTPENRHSKAHDVSGVVRSVIGAMQHRVTDQAPNDGKVHFDTNSLKALVKRAGDLRDSLSDIIRRADQITQSPVKTPRHERHDSSPAFTRVFDDPNSSPQRRGIRSRGNNSLMEASPENSPSSGLPQRMQMMTVN